MTTQRMGTLDLPSTDAHGTALFYVAVGLTVICAGLAAAAAAYGWPATTVNFGLAVMIVTWIGAFERQRYLIEQRRRHQFAEIDQLERLLGDS